MAVDRKSCAGAFRTDRRQFFSASVQREDSHPGSAEESSHRRQWNKSRKPISVAQLSSAFSHALIEASFTIDKNSKCACQY